MDELPKNKNWQNILLVIVLIIAVGVGGYAVKLTLGNHGSLTKSKVLKPGPISAWFLGINQGSSNMNIITRKLYDLGSFKDGPKGELCGQIADDLQFFTDHVKSVPDKNIDSAFKDWSRDQIASLKNCKVAYASKDKVLISKAEESLSGSIKYFTKFNDLIGKAIGANK